VRLRKAYAEFLERARVVRVATTDRRGVPHVVPVCAVAAAGRLYFGSGDDAQKVANLRANPRVAIVADDYSEAWDGLRGVMVTGQARLHSRGSAFRRGRDLLYAKYPQYPDQAALGVGDSIIVEVTPTRVFAWGFD
jgi:nitroimidazol reductase NimA-like FMN-containing flavoprotein (pyridoxamine 5'-phosphate oxidase superfamily)